MTHTDKQAVQAALDDLHKAKNWKDGKTPAMLPYDFLFHPDGKRKGHFATVKAALEAQMAGGWNYDMDAAPQREPICAPRTIRYLPYKPDGARQMGKPGRWQEWNGYGWSNCEDEPTCWQPLPIAPEGVKS